MSFTDVRNVRIKSLTVGTVAELRLGKAAVKSAKDDEVVQVKLVRHYKENEKDFVAFDLLGADGAVTGELVISRFPNAPWKFDLKYVSLLAVDESTFTIQRAASPIQTDAISDAIALIAKESEDVYAPEQLIALLEYVQKGKRMPTEIKALASRLAKRLVDELSNLPAKEDVSV